MKDKIGRNDPCPCGSGKKYKKCHGTYSSEVIGQRAAEGDGLLGIKITERSRAYDMQTLLDSSAKQPIPAMERLPLTLGGASSIPKSHTELGMFQRIYACLPEAWHLKEDPKLLLFDEGRYQVELRRSGVNIIRTNTRWKTIPGESPSWDIAACSNELASIGYYSCFTTFVKSKSQPDIEKLGRPITDALAGFVSLTVTPDLVRTPIWEATCFFKDGNPEWQVDIRNQLFRVSPPSVVPETFDAVNSLAASSISAPTDAALSTALRFMGNEARTQFEEDRFIWLYLAIRVLVDSYFQLENPSRRPPAQEQRFRLYAVRHFPGESEIIEDFKKVYEQRNNLLKGIDPTVITPDDVVCAEALCHRLLKCEVEKAQAGAK